MSNAGNFVNRIGLARRRMWTAIFIASIAVLVAALGWSRPMIIKNVGVSLLKNDCMKYAETMCNNGKD